MSLFPLGRSPVSLVFTPSNWDTPQTVTVTAVDDAAIEGNHTGVITHSSTSSDTGYRNLTIDQHGFPTFYDAWIRHES